jgi:glycosyltransferase involved in cell wall biosynthesis
MGAVDSRFSIVIPVRNGASKLPALISALDKLAAPSAELVLVDDGSIDGSWDLIKGYSSRQKPKQISVRGIRLDRGRGQQSAILAGLTVCRNQPVITMDDDLAHPVEAVPDLLSALENGADLAYADPPRRPGFFLRRAVSRIHQVHMSLITGTSPGIRVGSFRSLSSNLIDRILEKPVFFPYVSAQALTLFPPPVVVMVGTSIWNSGSEGRFSLLSLVNLEFRLAAAYGPLSLLGLSRGRSNDSAELRAGHWISEVTEP